MEWIPVICRETTEDDWLDKEEFPIFLDFPLPEHGQDVIISCKGHVSTDVCGRDGACCWLEGSDWCDVDAWMPLPEPYDPEEEDCCEWSWDESMAYWETSCGASIPTMGKEPNCPCCGRKIKAVEE